MNPKLFAPTRKGHSYAGTLTGGVEKVEVMKRDVVICNSCYNHYSK